MLAFAQALPEHDLLFLGRDLRHPRVIEAWLGAIGEGWIDSLVAEDETGAVVGTAALVRDPLGWSAHVGEVRLLVGSERRGAGLGRDLLEGDLRDREPHAGSTKLTAQMTPGPGRLGRPVRKPRLPRRGAAARIRSATATADRTISRSSATTVARSHRRGTARSG